VPFGLRCALLAIVAIVTSVTVPAARPAAAAPAVSVATGLATAYAQDAPDPHVLRVGSKYYAYTSGTSWGNHIGILTSTTPNLNYHTINGKSWGSSAFPTVPYTRAPAAWQVVGTQIAPGVFSRAGKWILFYGAQSKQTHEWCLSIATASRPQGPFTDRTGTKPWFCMDAYGGVVDPSPFVDTNGRAWLHFKTNTGSRAMSARLWAMALDSTGTKRASSPKVVLTQNSQQYSWETTIENPQMIVRNGQRYLFYAGNQWDSRRYAENYAVCAHADGPCTRARSTPFLREYSTVLGPGAGTAFTDASGNWWLAYHAWRSPCTNYGCGGKRRLFIKPLRFG
jgi:beta-xylosidase